MTAEQLEELLGKVTQGDWTLDGICISGPNYAAGDVCYMGEPAQWSGDTSRMIANWENNATLIALAPSLARRVLAAEKLAEAIRPVINSHWNESHIRGMYELERALQQYEASK